eukprot:358989-Chlamydomonas_euryale.AAC.7
MAQRIGIAPRGPRVERAATVHTPHSPHSRTPDRQLALPLPRSASPMSRALACMEHRSLHARPKPAPKRTPTCHSTSMTT